MREVIDANGQSWGVSFMGWSETEFWTEPDADEPSGLRVCSRTESGLTDFRDEA